MAGSTVSVRLDSKARGSNDTSCWFDGTSINLLFIMIRSGKDPFCSTADWSEFVSVISSAERVSRLWELTDMIKPEYGKVKQDKL